MVDSVKRSLRDGAAVHEQPPAIFVRDTVTTTGGPSVLKYLLRSVCDNISRNLSQAKGVVVVALAEPPENYISLLPHELKRNGDLPSWIRLLDCYTDPLGWERESTPLSQGENAGNDDGSSTTVWRHIRNLNSLSDQIFELGKASVQSNETDRFVVFFDSLSVLLRYNPTTAVMLLISVLKGHERVSALAGLVHADLHEPEIIKGFGYVSSTTIAVEPYLNPESKSAEGELIRIRQKRRNGRVREQVERVYFTAGGGVSFKSVEKTQSLEGVSGKVSAPKIQFNLTLTEKELEDRSRVILPFEHQGNGQEAKIYDGRANIKMSYLASQARDAAMPNAADSKEIMVSSGKDNIRRSNPTFEETVFGPADDGTESGSGLGEIHYLRDSDDERPDSDEDPDDDLDI